MQKRLFIISVILLSIFFISSAQESDFDKFEFEDDFNDEDFESKDGFNDDFEEKGDYPDKEEYTKRMQEKQRHRSFEHTDPIYYNYTDYPEYQNRGPGSFNQGPGNLEYRPPMMMFRDFDPKMMVMGKIMQGADEFLNPKDFMQMCPDADAMVNKAVQILKDKGKFNIQEACTEFREHLAECKERSQNMCKEIEERGATFRFNDKELSCPVNEEQLFNLCLEQRKKYDRGQFNYDQCASEVMMRFATSGCASQTQNSQCNYEEFIHRERQEYEQRCKILITPENNQSEEEYNRCIEQAEQNSNQVWEHQKQSCEQIRDTCDQEKMLEECKARLEEQKQRIEEEAQKMCREQTGRMSSEMNKRCEETKMHLQRCKEMSQQACTQIEKTVQACESVTEQEIIELMKEQAKRMCNMYSLREKNYYASKFLETRNEIPGDLQIAYDQTTEDIVNTTQVAQDLETKITKKSVFYKLLRFIGLTKKQDLEEAQKLTQTAENLQETIDALTSILDQVDNPVAKAALQEQINKLKERKESLLDLAKKRAGRTQVLLESPTGAVIGFRERKSILKEIFD